MLTAARIFKEKNKLVCHKLIIDAHQLLLNSKKKYVWQDGGIGAYCRKLAISEGIDLQQQNQQDTH